ncbi:MAG TPA: CBS domain-containing protein [Pyrinomonadaceae bacterium]|nr:CBS domain-containing protein [Pyrinomonadaceae bacterium]
MNCPACGSENIDGIDRCENCLAPFRDLDVPRADAAEGLARSVMEDQLSQLDYDDPILVSADSPAGEVAQRMKAARTGCALVLEDGKLAGIFTEHDLLGRFASTVGGGSLTWDSDSPVTQLMTRNPETLHEQDSVASALNKMSMGQYRHLPVARADGTYAVASIKSVLKYIATEDW